MSFMDNLYASPLAPPPSSPACFPSTSFSFLYFFLSSLHAVCHRCTKLPISGHKMKEGTSWRHYTAKRGDERERKRGRGSGGVLAPGAIMRFKLILLLPLWGYTLSRMSISISYSFSISFSLCNASFLALFQFTHDFYFFFLRLQSCQLGDKVLHKYIFLVAAAHCALIAFYTIYPSCSQWPLGAPAAKEETKPKPGKLY